MGRIKELKDKLKADGLNDEEQKELDVLLAEAKADEPDEPKADEGDEAGADAQVEALADKMAKSFLKKIEPISQMADKLAETKVEIKHEAKFIVDPQMGRVAVEQLENEKVVLTDRKKSGKDNYEVSKKTLHFIQAMAQGDKQKLQLLTEGTGAAGGFLVPEEFANIVIEDRQDATVMRGLATVIPVTTDTFHLPSQATRPKAFWRSEGAVKSTTTATFGENVLTPYSLAAIVGLSNELIADASIGGPIVSMVARQMAQALAMEEDKAFWVGSGSGQPTGIDTYTFTTISGGITDATRADAIKTAFFRLPQAYRSAASFVFNKNTLAKIATLKDTTNNYLLQRLGDDPTVKLLGRPVYEQNDIGDGKGWFGDYSYYYIADRQGITVDTSTEATVASQSAFERNLTYVRVEERVDGELTLTNPIVEFSSMGGL